MDPEQEKQVLWGPWGEEGGRDGGSGIAADKVRSQEHCPPGHESQSAQRRTRVSFRTFSRKLCVIYDTLVSKREKINCQGS